MSESQSLDSLAIAVNDKIAIGKDREKPYIGLEHLESQGARLLGWSQADSSISTNSVFRSNDVLFGKLRPNLRKCVLAPFDGYCSTDIVVLRAKPGIDPRFLARVFQTESVGAEAEKTAIGTKMPRTSWGQLKHHLVFAPHLDEQSAIARILDTLDTQIERTQALIAKLEQVKEGLLHDLLTRGVDENGELRPSAEDAPELYKASALGLIPREWEAIPLKSVIQHTIDFRGRTPRKLGMDWGGGDILALSANNVQPGRIDTSREAYFGSEELYQRWMTNGCTQKGDVLLTMEAPLGNIAQIPDDAKYILSQRVIALRFDPAQILNDFAFWQMQSEEFQTSMALRSTGRATALIHHSGLIPRTRMR
ncbi:MAG: restriction endonuclease subunit S, partial [Burkholderiaceae bacterium]|nr:restriction endonuclease subunit S [Burkholderiaceae bacterium]